ncbi:MAG: hypothetical protein LBI66_05860 [Burkholderiaceae bacterium]|jgi:hypothetical protein|nr:hypothetical protein [Burkholderiaceae bacterium]
MSDASSFGFGKFIPGFDFLQGLAQSAGSATARPLGRLPEWVAPTVSIEEVDKRISELKAVQFWLEQNGKALAATIQALEVQRMTLSTLKGMNVSMGELAQAFQFPAASAGATSGAAEAQRSDHSDWPMSSAGAARTRKSAAAPAAAAAPTPASAPQEPPAAAPGPQAAAPQPHGEGQGSGEGSEAPAAQAAAMGQAMQWWGALTQQFQQIAAKALAEPLAPEAVAAAQRATGMAGEFAKAAMDRVAAQTGAFAAQAAKTRAAPASPATHQAAKKAPAAAAKKAGGTRTAAARTTGTAAPKAAPKAAAKTVARAASVKPATKRRPAG